MEHGEDKENLKLNRKVMRKEIKKPAIFESFVKFTME